MPWTKGRPSWNKGLSAKEHNGLALIAKARRLKNNFEDWRRVNPIYYAQLKKSVELAEFYGTLLGDGCLEKFARTEKFCIAFNSKEVEHIEHITKIIEELFKKKPSVIKVNNAHCIKVTLYQKNLSRRLKFPTGIKSSHNLIIPSWIKRQKKYLIRCLKALFETDGDWVIDRKYGTNVIKFTNVIDSLLDDVHTCLLDLGFTAHRGKRRVTISRAKEVARFVNLIKFRQYN